MMIDRIINGVARITACALLSVLLSSTAVLDGADRALAAAMQADSAGAGFSRQQIQAAVAAFISSNAPWNAKQMKISAIRVAEGVALPAGCAALTVSAPPHTDWIGPVPFQVRATVDGRLAKMITVPADIQVWSDVVLTAKPLGRDQPITAADIEVHPMNLARVPADAILDPRQVIGQRPSRAIAANTILRSGQLNLPPLVRRGDVVQLLAESETMRITTRGVALENGMRGQCIKVKNMRSDKVVYGKIIDTDTLKVDF